LILENKEGDIKMADKIDINNILESEIDKSSVVAILEELTEICYGKSAHLRENWQDNSASSDWDKTGGFIESIIDKLPNRIGITTQ
jgi:hypothetical protein